MGDSRSPQLRQAGLCDPVAPFFVSAKPISDSERLNCFRTSPKNNAVISKMLKESAGSIGDSNNEKTPQVERHRTFKVPLTLLTRIFMLSFAMSKICNV